MLNEAMLNGTKTQRSREGATAPIPIPPTESFLDLATTRLQGLCGAVGFEGDDVTSATALLSEALFPWGPWPIGSAPRASSDIGDDHFPLEFSLALDRDAVEVRILFGGTLSVGGISAVSYRRGAQVDHVLEVEVVTGDAQHITCSIGEKSGPIRSRTGWRWTLRNNRARDLVVDSGANAGQDHRPFLRGLRSVHSEHAHVDRTRNAGGSVPIWLDPRSHTRYELNAVSFYSPPRTPETARLLEGIGAPTLAAAHEIPRAWLVPSQAEMGCRMPPEKCLEEVRGSGELRR